MRLLVTGTAGFIGFHLARALLTEGHHVFGIDNFNDYYSVKLKRDRHAILEKHENYIWKEMDLCNYQELDSIFSQWSFDCVCHLAAQAGVRYSLTHPFTYQKSNLEAFLNILEVCRLHQVSRLVYASSSSVYGGNKKLPFHESDRVDKPISLYAATKKSNELMAHCYSHLFNLQTIGLRFFTVYGPWGRPDMAMWIFTESILKGKPIKVFNHGRMSRDFTYIDDIIQGVKGALFSDNLNTYEIFNLGNHKSENLMEMINLLADTLGKKPEMIMMPMQPGDVPDTRADIDLARKKLNFSPQTTISKGIPSFVTWYRNYHGIS